MIVRNRAPYLSLTKKSGQRLSRGSGRATTLTTTVATSRVYSFFRRHSLGFDGYGLIRRHILVLVVFFQHFGCRVFFPLIRRKSAATKVETKAAETTAAVAKGEETAKEEQGGEPGVSQAVIEMRVFLAVSFDHVDALTAVSVVEGSFRFVGEDKVSAADFPEAIRRRGIVQILIRMVA